MFDYTLYLVTDSRFLKHRSLADAVGEAIDAGVTVVQLRDKNAHSRELYETGLQLKSLLAGTGVPLIINDRVDIMQAVDADGVHVGPNDLPLATVRRLAGSEKLVGYSVDTVEDLQYAQNEGADYVGVGPVFATATKTDAGPVLGIEGLSKVVQNALIPCVGIGGIDAENCSKVFSVPEVSGVCAASAIMGADSITEAVRSFRKSLRDCK